MGQVVYQKVFFLVDLIFERFIVGIFGGDFGVFLGGSFEFFIFRDFVIVYFFQLFVGIYYVCFLRDIY